jgi:HSP20 family protein
MLVRYDPFRQLDRMTDQLFGTAQNTPRWMPMDAIRHGHEVVLRFDLPGVASDSIELTVERNELTVKAERSWEPSEGDEVLARERPQGSVTRQVLLGEALDTDHLEARYDAGVLTVTIPVSERAKPRRVEVRTGSEPESIEAKSVEATAS